MDEIIKELKVEVRKGIKIGNKALEIINYADDTVLITQSEDDLQMLLHKIWIIATIPQK